jgi:hypothetical protein
MRHYTSDVRVAKGLRPLENAKTDDVYMVSMSGLINRDGALHSLDPVNNLVFPDPVIQINKLKSIYIAVTTTGIYEIVGSTLVPKLSIVSTGTWGIADFGEFVMLVDATRVVKRDPLAQTYALAYDVPKGADALNYNGQCLIVGGHEL